ncbi:hypothetical protein Tsubulata_004134 [Turnera subulata]|uniref:Uncharacterized protein n=1 Tax=Turnera subulata TaxID=218843 RepID=A0A9Q0IZH5_9ROSI|nr:hypothetical protein Tsubulata_004134 [Turnera subulata]
MGWNYPDVSLEEMAKLIKGFVDIIILASGYRSSGLLAHWDALNIKKAFQWGSFFENVLRRMSSSDIYQDSVKELDLVLLEMTSDPSFPQGLATLSCDTLTRARSFVLLLLFHNLPLRDSHLRAFIMAVIEMDLDKLSVSENDCLRVYLDRLTLQNTSCDLFLERRGSMKHSGILCGEISASRIENSADNGLTEFALQEIFKRQSVVSCISTVETGLDILSNAIRYNSSNEYDGQLCKEKLNLDGSLIVVGSKQSVGFVTWNDWKSEILAYFLDKRTVRLVSGASMIFSAPKIQWTHVFEGLNTLEGQNDDNLGETIEIGILEYLMRLLGGHLRPLWKLPPVLAAVAIPFWYYLLFYVRLDML